MNSCPVLRRNWPQLIKKRHIVLSESIRRDPPHICTIFHKFHTPLSLISRWGSVLRFINHRSKCFSDDWNEGCHTEHIYYTSSSQSREFPCLHEFPPFALWVQKGDRMKVIRIWRVKRTLWLVAGPGQRRLKEEKGNTSNKKERER